MKVDTKTYRTALKVAFIAVLTLCMLHAVFTNSVKDLCSSGTWQHILGYYYFCPAENSYRYCEKLSSTNRTCYLMDESDLPKAVLSDRKILKLVKSDGVSSLLNFNITYIGPHTAKIHWKWKNQTIRKKVFSSGFSLEQAKSFAVKTIATCKQYKNVSLCKGGKWKAYNSTHYICTSNGELEKCINISQDNICYHPKIIQYCTNISNTTKYVLKISPKIAYTNLLKVKSKGLPVKYFVTKKAEFVNQSSTTSPEFTKFLKSIPAKQAKLSSGKNLTKSLNLDVSKSEGYFILNLRKAAPGQRVIIGFNSTVFTVEEPDNCEYINDITPSFNVSPSGDYDYYNLTLYINGTEKGSAMNVPNNTYAVITSSVLTTEGLYEWYVEAKVGGTSVSNTSTMYFTLDTTPPVVTINYPRNNGRVRVYNPCLNFTYIEDHPNNVYFQIDGLPTNYTTHPYLTDDHMVLYLKMDEGASNMAYDSSKYGNNGTIHGATWTTGKFGSALEFDGVDDYVEVPDSDSLNITDAITIEAWVKILNLDTANRIVAKRIGVKSAYDFVFRGDSLKRLNILFRDGDNMDNLFSAPNVIIDTLWHHVVVVRNDYNVEFFVDGEPVGTAIARYDMITLEYPVLIGCLEKAASWFYGTIDEVRIYNRALSAEEIKEHYYKGLKTHYVRLNDRGYPDINNTTKLLLTFDQSNKTSGSADGETVYDISGNGNDGTIHGANWTTGKFGSALEFDGVDDYVYCGNDESLRPSDAITLEAWIKPLSSGYEIINYRINGAGPYYVYHIRKSGAAITLYDGSDDGLGYTIPYTLSKNSYHHSVLVFSRAERKFKYYVDGILRGSKTTGDYPLYTHCTPNHPDCNIHGFFIGCARNGIRHFPGTIDEVRIYNRALSAEEIKEHYRLGNGVHNVTAYVVDLAGNKGTATSKFSIRYISTSLDYVFYSVIGSFGAAYLVYRLRRRRRRRRH